MATKKLAREKKPAAVRQAVARKVVWTVPVAMLMLCVGAGAIVLAMRESSNVPAAATPAMATMTTSTAEGKTSPDVALPASAPAASAPAASSTVHANAKPVSVTGCLQRDGGGFTLKNTEGAAAPKGRSWKSGFLKRSASSLDLSDTGNSAHLSSHVGQRVSVTGTLVDRDMHVLSLRRVAASCE